jgi:phosphoglycolate phosphatase-like HAD superfamily hydrolase
VTDLLPRLAVFDIDGVVADVRHRLHHLERRPKNWAGFFAAARRDPPLPEGVELAKGYARSHHLVWLTGRPEHLREVTLAWLAAQDLPHEWLLMRPANDRSPARLFKERQLKYLGREAQVDLVVDDDPAVVTRLLEAGWPVRQADWVAYREPLRQAQEGDGRT